MGERVGRGNVAVVIPTLNEAGSIGRLIAEIPRRAVERVIVDDDGSTDATVAEAKAAGADAIDAGRGYGRACLKGAQDAQDAEVIVFMDGDGSDHPRNLDAFIAPIRAGTHDFVIGSRVRGVREPGRDGVAPDRCRFRRRRRDRFLYGTRDTDMCAFRAIRRDALLGLGMRELTYGWNVEMQMRAARASLRVLEVPMPCRRRTSGVSKVAGSLGGTLKAGVRIVATMIRIAAEPTVRPTANVSP